ncbi:MAG: hypothetical protein GY856_55225, partial [bacterium]|nr:hypothetical protein [bacterium]
TRNLAGDLLDGYAYTYDKAGRRTTMRRLQDQQVHTFEYDEQGRLERWERDQDWFEEYGYDLVGNRVSLLDPEAAVSYSYDPRNRLTEEIRTINGSGATATIYDWDANGNLTRKTTGTDQTTFGYDALNRMVEVIDATGVKTYGYRPDGIRARESTPASTRRFLYSAEDILGIHDGTSYTSFFSHGPSVDEPLAQISQGTPSYLHHDGSGSITAISSISGEPVGTRSYKPFGEIVDQTGIGSRYGYTGREPDAAGLMYYRARYYQPAAGRFTTEDRFRGVPE